MMLSLPPARLRDILPFDADERDGGKMLMAAWLPLQRLYV